MLNYNVQFQIDHNHGDLSKFYTIDPKTVGSIFHMGGLPKPFIEQTTMFAETALMIRQPALEIINNLKLADYQKPAIRYLLCILLIQLSYIYKLHLVII